MFSLGTGRKCSRDTQVSCSTQGAPVRGVLGRVRGRARCLFVVGSRISVSGGMSVGTGRVPISGILSSLFGNAGVRCLVRNSRVVLSGGMKRAGASKVGRSSGEMAVSNGIASDAKRPLVNIGVALGKAGRKMVDSVSNGCSVHVPRLSKRLAFSCVKCGTVAITVQGGVVGIALTRSARILSRMIIATLNVRGGTSSLACTARGMGKSRLAHTGSTGFVGTLRKGATNLMVAPGSANTNNSSGLLLHNGTSVLKGGRPLVVLSKIPVTSHDATRVRSTLLSNNGDASKKSNLSGVGPSSVTSVGVLGNTGTTTLCNSGTTGKILVVAAGGKRRKHASISMSDDVLFRAPLMAPGFRGACNTGTRFCSSADLGPGRTVGGHHLGVCS